MVRSACLRRNVANIAICPVLKKRISSLALDTIISISLEKFAGAYIDQKGFVKESEFYFSFMNVIVSTIVTAKGQIRRPVLRVRLGNRGN